MKTFVIFFAIVFSALFWADCALSAQSHLNAQDGNDLVSANVYPNPATEFIQFDYKLSQTVGSPKLIINNILGVTVAEFDLQQDENKLRVAVNEFKNGVYFYTIYSGSKSLFTKKFVIRH